MSEATEKKVTRLVIGQAGDTADSKKKYLSMFLNTTKKDGTPAASPFFNTGKDGVLRGFLVKNGKGEPTGAIRLTVPAQAEGEEGTLVGMLYKKDGEHGVFFSGYTAPLVEVGKSADGQYPEYAFESGLEADEEGKFTNAVNVTAFLEGPEANVVIDALPTITRPKANKPAM